MEKRKKIIITGASKGIGRKIAERLAKNHDLALIARSQDLLKNLKTKIEKSGGNALIFKADITKKEEVEEAIEKFMEKLGHIDVLINNAGIGDFKRVDQFTLEEVKYMFEVNVFGTFLCTKQVVPAMIKRKQGQIINIASIAGLSGFKGGSAYAASKFAVVGFSESLREDLKEHGIAVSIVCPGSVNTGFGGGSSKDIKSHGGYMLEPDDVARTVEYLVEEASTANTKLVELKPRRRENYRV